MFYQCLYPEHLGSDKVQRVNTAPHVHQYLWTRGRVFAKISLLTSRESVTITRDKGRNSAGIDIKEKRKIKSVHFL